MIKRILALLLAVLLLAIVVLTFICGITGSRYFIGMLFLCITVPILCYAIALVARLLKGKSNELKQEMQNEQETDTASVSENQEK